MQLEPGHLLAAIVLLPALGAFVNGLFGRRLTKEQISAIGVGTVATAFVLSAYAFVRLFVAGEESQQIHLTAWTWFRLSPSTHLSIGLLCDRLSSVMLLVVTGVGSLIHLYSVGYMHKEEPSGYSRYFSYLNLFTFSMLVLVLGDSLPVLFVGWEGVGLCSYLLIGFWFTDEAKATAGKKAFIVNRIGDFGFLLGIFFLFRATGALDFATIAERTGSLSAVIDFGFFDLAVATAACLCLLVGATGKSAQIPLYVWLPDAMAGPTPVSALIHAATMVTAGVYMVARLGFVFVLSPPAMGLVALVGALTALFAATIALVQNDIKKVLAYSTVSQLGYMFLGVGVGAFSAGIFHLVTHAFFKACLFLGAGAVIHALHEEQDIQKMGGLGPHLPGTRWTFLASTAAIAGFPLTSGFFSKDEILWKAYATAGVWQWLPYFVYTVALVGAVLTAFYMTRLYLLVFEGKSRVDPHALEHLHKPGPVMVWPLIVLGTLALVGGFLGVPHANVFEHWLEPVFASSERYIGMRHDSFGMELGFMAVSICAMAVGAGLAYSWYLRQEGRPAAALVEKWPRLHALVVDKWRIDELYDRIVVRPVVATAKVCFDVFDRIVIDTILVHGTAIVVRSVGAVLRLLQTGAVHTYAAFLVVGLAAVFWLVTSPAAEITISNRAGDVVELRAKEGPGYEFRWDLDGDKEWDSEEWSEEPAVSGVLKGQGPHRVRLEVRNSWGSAATEEVVP